MIKENICQLTTPSGEGASISIEDNNIIIPANMNLILGNYKIQGVVDSAGRDRLVILPKDDDIVDKGNTITGCGIQLASSIDTMMNNSVQWTIHNTIGDLAYRSITYSGNTGTFQVDVNNADNTEVIRAKVDSIYSASNNHIQYTNGLLICWGSHKVDTVITFPVSFISNPIMTYGYTGVSTNNYHKVFVVYGYNFSTTGLSMRIYDVTNSAFITANCEYIAIGRWK